MLVDESPLYACTWMHEVYKVEDKALERPQQVPADADADFDRPDPAQIDPSCM